MCTWPRLHGTMLNEIIDVCVERIPGIGRKWTRARIIQSICDQKVMLEDRSWLLRGIPQPAGSRILMSHRAAPGSRVATWDWH